MAKVRILSGSEPATLIEKNITANGTYNASADEADGYSSVNVNVPTHNVLLASHAPASSEGENGDTFIHYADQVTITLQMSISGGYNGGAQLNCSVDDQNILSAVGTSPYNLDYDVKSGSVTYYGHTISVLVTPPATNTSDLSVTWSIDGVTVWTESIHYTGANTSYGYGTQAESSPQIISISTAIIDIYYKQGGLWLTKGDNININ